MYDNETKLDARLAAEFGLRGEAFPFLPKVSNDEEELKYTTNLFVPIRQNIHNAPNRRVDARDWEKNTYLLVTLNLDTPDRLLARNGYSLRVRFAYNPNNADPIGNIDMSIKTSLQDDKVVKLFNQTRGEWEIALPDLRPDMAAMIAEHEKEDDKRKKRPLPDFFKSPEVRDAIYYVETIGCTMRNSFPSYEKFTRHGKTHLTKFSHTEDWKNIFLTPHADVVTGEDEEAEVEFDGFVNMTDKDIDSTTYEKLKRKAMKLMHRLILSTDMVNVRVNTRTKSVRAREALESYYGPSHAEILKNNFDRAACIERASFFSLSQRILPQDIRLDNIAKQAKRLFGEMERIIKPEESSTFQPAKYHL